MEQGKSLPNKTKGEVDIQMLARGVPQLLEDGPEARHGNFLTRQSCCGEESAPGSDHQGLTAG